MNKMFSFMVRNLIRIILKYILKIFKIRSNNVVLLGLRSNNKITSDYFMHNTKCMFLKYGKQEQPLKFIYLCDDKDMARQFISNGFKNIYSRRSFMGLFYTIIAKCWLYDNNEYDVYNPIMSGNSYCVNLWHGVPLKRIGYDIQNNYNNISGFKRKIYDFFRPKDRLYVVNSEYEQSCYETAFLTKKENVQIMGSPRLDILFQDIPHSDLFMEKDFANIKNFKEQGKKLFFYTPTFRDTGKDISGWLKSDKLKQFLKTSNAVLVCKLHFADKNSLNFELTEEFYKMDSVSDIYPVLKYSDALITDYSSIYFDYLLLDKPILYYPIDIEEYQKKCRGFYRPYEELTAGVKSYNEDELIYAMQDVINGKDEYKAQRKQLRDKMFKYQDGKNCERIIEWIRSLN